LEYLTEQRLADGDVSAVAQRRAQPWLDDQALQNVVIDGDVVVGEPT
jgi:hypothetical protein